MKEHPRLSVTALQIDQVAQHEHRLPSTEIHKDEGCVSDM